MRRLAVLAAVCALVASACGDTATLNSLTNTVGGFSFSYPAAWDDIPDLEIETQVGQIDTLAFVAVGALDSSSGNLVGASVQVDELTVIVSPQDERRFLESEFDPLMISLATEARGTLGAPQWTVVSGHDARVYVIESEVRGQDLTSRLTVFVVADHLYKTLCQAPPESFSTTASDCDVVTSTLEIG